MKLKVKTKEKEQTGIQLTIKSRLQDNHLDRTETDALPKLEFTNQRGTEINIVSNVHGVGTGKNVRCTEDAHIHLFITYHNCVTERPPLRRLQHQPRRRMWKGCHETPRTSELGITYRRVAHYIFWSIYREETTSVPCEREAPCTLRVDPSAFQVKCSSPPGTERRSPGLGQCKKAPFCIDNFACYLLFHYCWSLISWNLPNHAVGQEIANIQDCHSTQSSASTTDLPSPQHISLDHSCIPRHCTIKIL